ncbi:hypothetical protein AB6A40_002282 [Gnathostoma spinigerum]|uniref:Serine carboxypeptidase n=1 Tax=Gnathostoma spinigerum TaxID=75299 RepID=A0ABD6E6B7_9BILA
MHVSLFAVVLCAAYLHAIPLLHLPDSPQIDNIQYTGYLFDKKNNHYLHYWFVKSSGTPENDPLVVWLPPKSHCSVYVDFFEGLSPLKFTSNGTLTLNNYSLTTRANILVIETSVSTGFSYGMRVYQPSNDGNSDGLSAYEALKMFYREYPEMKNNKVYIGGRQYGGAYIASALVDHAINDHSENAINITGILIESGYLDDTLRTEAYIKYQYDHGFIDEKTAQRVNEYCCKNDLSNKCDWKKYESLPKPENYLRNEYDESTEAEKSYMIRHYCNKFYRSMNTQMIESIDKESIFEESETPTNSKVSKGLPKEVERMDISHYINRNDVKYALAVRGSPEWHDCSRKKFPLPIADIHARIKLALEKGVRILLFNGDSDMLAPPSLAERFAQSLGLSETSSKTAFQLQDHAGGFNTKYANLEVYEVTHSGGRVKYEKPSATLHLLDTFFNKE